MTILTNAPRLPGAQPFAALVEIELVGEDGAAVAGYLTGTGQVVQSQRQFHADGKNALSSAVGEWSVNLTPNASIEPAGTVYRVVEHRGRSGHITHVVEVPAAGGPYTVLQCLSDIPGALPAPPLAAHIATLHTNMVPATVASPSATRLALQALIDGGGVIDGGKRTYIIDEELEIKVDGTTLHLEGATIQGPVAGTALGGLLCVSDRADPTRVVKNVSVLGGRFVPKNAGDNGLCAVAATDLIIDGSTVDLTTGLRGFAIQTDSTFTGNGGKPLQRIRLSNISSYGGGENGLNIESDGLADLIDQVTVRGAKISGAASPVRISAGSNLRKLTGIVVDGVEADGASGTGILWFHAKQSKLSNVLLRGVTGNGIEAANTDDNQWSGITILGPAATGIAIAFTDGTHASVADVDIQGSFAIALYNGMVADLTATNVRIKSATIGLYTTGNAQRSVYDGFTFEDVATKLNAFRAGDLYRDFAERSGTTVAAYVPA